MLCEIRYIFDCTVYIEHKWQIKVGSRSKSEEERAPCMVNVAHPSPK